MTLETPIASKHQNVELMPLKTVFFPHYINEWNNLTLEFREVRSLSLFKTKLIRLVRPMKGQLYGIHDQAGVCRLTQLRLGLSPLRETNLNKISLIPLTQCACQMMALKPLFISCCSAKNILSTELCSLAKLHPFVHLMELTVVS